MRTAHVANLAGVNIQSLRYYERRGLLPEPKRTQGRHRVYGPDAVQIVRFIKHVQELGFTLEEVGTLLHLANGGPDSRDLTRHLATEKISVLDDKIASLGSMRASLTRLVDTCARPRADRDCPLLQGFLPTHDERDGLTDESSSSSPTDG